tara:strand:+ start:2976 stop:4022 length:1047 start_codon:yes stop_codon:yes gene_type:complete
MRELRIDDRIINDDSDCFVIAEVGHNHQGELETAKQLFLEAKRAGVDAVKLQKRNNKKLYTKDMYSSIYDNKNSFGTTYGGHREALEFGLDEYQELQSYAHDLDLIFFATPFDFHSVDFLTDLDCPLFKVASGDIKSTPLLEYIAKKGKPMILSTGGSTLEDIERAYDTIYPVNDQLAILQCTAAYPCEPNQMNLRVIEKLRLKFPDTVIGLSDHQNGISMSLVAYTLGARIIEKHFTINHAWKGTDHAFSLEPIGLKKMVRDLQWARIAMGDGIKKTIEDEIKPLFKMGKKLVAARSLKKGHQLTKGDIAIKSPNDGLPPYELNKVLGKKLKRGVSIDENIELSDLV